MTCWFHPQRPPCFIVLGRFGDVIQLLPAFKLVHERTGVKPVVMVARAFASVLEGVSYVTPHVIEADWHAGLPFARAEAEYLYGGGTVPRWWSGDRSDFPFCVGGIVLQTHGIGWKVDPARWPDYGTGMWDRAGFTREEMLSTPLVLDRRIVFREQALARSALHASKTPAVLYNFIGHSSPFAFEPEVINTLNRHFGGRVRFVNIGEVRAHRVFDLVGVMDEALGLITSDTSTLHLAAASKRPYIAFTVDGWSQSVPKGLVSFACGYREVRSRLAEVVSHVEHWLTP